jgi:hypothetical protein
VLGCGIARLRRALQHFSGLPLRLATAYRLDRGEVMPPSDLAKRLHILRIFRERGHRVFVESGTYLGGTVEFLLARTPAERLISVEIEPALYEAARARFAAEPRVELHHGDAVELIPRIVSELDQPPLVWLDGHFTGGVNEAPFGEVEPAPTILGKLGETGVPEGSTILVDDLRLFGREDGFPEIDALTEAARRTFPRARIFPGLDSLVIYA